MSVSERQAQMDHCSLLVTASQICLSRLCQPGRHKSVVLLSFCSHSALGQYLPLQEKTMNRNVLVRGVVGTVASSAAKPVWETHPGKAQQMKVLGTA